MIRTLCELLAAARFYLCLGLVWAFGISLIIMAKVVADLNLHLHLRTSTMICLAVCWVLALIGAGRVIQLTWQSARRALRPTPSEGPAVSPEALAA